MKVRVLRSSYGGMPKDWLLPGASEHSVLHLTVGSELDVHAMVVFKGHMQFCVIDDLKMFSWQYAWVFEILDGTVAPDWIVSSLPDQGEPLVVIGPEFMGASIEAYADFIEQVPAAVKKMWDRWERLQNGPDTDRP